MRAFFEMIVGVVGIVVFCLAVVFGLHVVLFPSEAAMQAQRDNVNAQLPAGCSVHEFEYPKVRVLIVVVCGKTQTSNELVVRGKIRDREVTAVVEE